MSEPGSEPREPEDLKSLGERLDKARRDRKEPTTGDRKNDEATDSALGLGFRIGLELVVAVLFGLAVGWLIDRELGTRPLGMIVFLFLGFGAGLLNIYRAMNNLGMAAGYRPAQDDKTRAAAEEDEED